MDLKSKPKRRQKLAIRLPEKATSPAQGNIPPKYSRRPDTIETSSSPRLQDLHDVVFPNWVSEESQDWIGDIEKSITMDRTGQRLVQLLNKYFETSRNPYWAALYTCITCGDFKHNTAPKLGPAPLAFRIMATFHDWLKASSLRLPKMELMLNEEVKIAAFSTVSSHFSGPFFKLLYKIYRFDTSPELFVPYVWHAIENKNYVNACQFVHVLNLHSSFAITDIIFPLFAQNKMNYVNEYLNDNREQQIQFVTFLDSLCKRTASSVGQLVAKYKIPKAQEEKLSSATLTKSVKKWAKKYSVPNKYWPEVSSMQAVSTLSYFMHMFYGKKSIPVEDWEDMIVGFTLDNVKLQREAVFLSHSHGDLNLAVRLARKFNLAPDDKDIPYDVQDALTRDDVPNASGSGRKNVPLVEYGIYSEDEEDYDPGDQWGLDEEEEDDYGYVALPANCSRVAVVESKYYALKLPFESVFMVETSEDYENCIAYIEKNASTVGIDCEWRPLFGESGARLALIQLAIPNDRVYLLDTLVLNLGLTDHLQDKHWFQLVEKVFSNPAIEKIGFSLHNDWNMLASFHPAFKEIAKVTVNLTDVMVVCEHALERNPHLFSHFTGVLPETKSLSTFIELCFGLPLDKAEQFSNWERRPLRSSQKLYAALDAYCLLDICESLKANCAAMSIEFSYIKKELKGAVKVPVLKRSDIECREGGHAF